MNSSRVLARGGEQLGASRGGRYSSKVPAKGAVRGQRTEPGGGGRKDREQPSDSQQTGHSKGCWNADETRMRPERDRDVTNRGLPHQRYKPSKPRPTSTESPTP